MSGLTDINTERIYFKISHTTRGLIRKYGKMFGVSDRMAIRFLICEQINLYINSNGEFENKYKKCKPRESIGYRSPYKFEDDKDTNDEKEEPTGILNNTPYISLQVTEFIKENIAKIEAEFNDETNKVVNNLIHMGLNEKFVDYDSNYAERANNYEADTQRPTLQLSKNCSILIENIITKTGISQKDLISLIIGNYLIEHYNDFYNGIYSDMNGNEFRSIW